MKISQIYKLNKTQYELDFVDIDPEIDTPLFLDPYYISNCDFDFAITADSSIRSYFELYKCNVIIFNTIHTMCVIMN